MVRFKIPDVYADAKEDRHGWSAAEFEHAFINRVFPSERVRVWPVAIGTSNRASVLLRRDRSRQRKEAAQNGGA